MPEAIKLLLELVLCSALVWWVSRFAHRRVVTMITFATLGIRLAIGVALYVISAWHLPVLRQLQMPGGFWQFGYDGYLFHNQAIDLLERLPSAFLPAVKVAWTQTSDGFDSVSGFARFLVVLYRLLGPNPSAGLIIVAAAAAALVPLAYLTAMKYGLSERQALVPTLLVALWPSSLVWTGQLLRDPIQWLAAFAIALGAVTLLSSSWPSRPTHLLSAVLLVVTGELLSARWLAYVGGAWLLAILIGTADRIATSDLRHRRWVALIPVVLTLAIVMSVPVPAYQSASERLLKPLLHAVAPQQFSAADQLTAAERHYVTLITGDPDFVNSHPQRALEIARPPAEPAVAQSQGRSNISRFSMASACGPVAPLLILRADFMDEHGASQMDSGIYLDSCASVAAYLPRAAEHVFLEPLPMEWLRPGGQLGSLRFLAVPDALLLWLLVPGLAVGCIFGVRQRSAHRVMLALYVVILGLAMGIVVTNFGTLFRLRLSVILPATIMATEGWAFILAALSPRLRSRTAMARPVGVGVD